MTGRGPAVLLLLLATACGSSNELAGDGRSPDAGGSAGAGGSTTDGGGAAGSGGGFFLDAGDAYTPPNPWADSGTIDAGVFDCDGMCCDGTTHYCRIVYGGAAPIFGTSPEAGSAMCSDAGTSTWCIPLPAQCVGAPSCACVGTQYGGACQCDSSGGGVTVKCYAP